MSLSPTPSRCCRDKSRSCLLPPPMAAAFYSGNYLSPQQHCRRDHTGLRFALDVGGAELMIPVMRMAATGPHGPFTGYAAVLARSRFLGPTQRLLQEVCDHLAGAGPKAFPMQPDSFVDDVSGLASSASSSDPSSDGEELWYLKSRLASLQDEVCKRYNQYLQQVQAVMDSFDAVAGLCGAAPYAAMALNAMSKQFQMFKSLISTHLRNANNSSGKQFFPSTTAFPAAPAAAAARLQQAVNAGALDQQSCIWRPQRGLPERAVAVLRAWLFEHFLHPYPSDGDKQMLARQTGLTRNQVSNWFINARVRLWKPMVEEIHGLEVQQVHNHIQHSSLDSSAGSGREVDARKRGRNTDPAAWGDGAGEVRQRELWGIPAGSINGDVSSGVAGGISLTLGLRQSIARATSFDAGPALPSNLARRFGLDEDGAAGRNFVA